MRDIERVALHEFGHSIGLGHSNMESSIMWPVYPDNDLPRAALSPEDIFAAMSIYPGMLYKSKRRRVT